METAILKNQSFEKIYFLIDKLGGIKGRKKTQKIIYILQESGVEFNFKFSYHLFGPYSNELHLGLTEMVNNKLLKETSSSPYTYSKLGEISFQELLEDLVVEFAKTLNQISTKELEAIATLLFLKVNFSLSDAQMKDKFIDLKPDLVNKYQSSLNFINKNKSKFLNLKKNNLLF